MSALYPPQLLLLPVQLQHRLPPSLQSVDLEVLLVLHTVISLFASLFTYHIAYALPLALFGLVAIQSPLISTLLPHFLFLWVISIPLDVAWLLYRVDEARLLIIALMGANMCFKVVSAGQAARILQSQGALPEAGTFRGLGTNAGWPGSSAENGASPFGLPGSWSGQAPSQSQQPYTDAGNASGAYQSVYEDGDDRAQENDAPQIRVDRLANLATSKPSKGNYQAID